MTSQFLPRFSTCSDNFWMMSKRLVVVAVLLTLAANTVAQTQKERVLYNFPTNGASGRLISDKQGNLYGVTHGFVKDYGTVFELQLLQDRRWSYRLLYRFMGGLDGAFPQPGLALDDAGNLYGAAEVGGPNSCNWTTPNTCGVVFELTPTAQGQWTETILYNFLGSGGPAIPSTGLISDGQGRLYGGTAIGGPNFFDGTIFRLTQQLDGTWAEEQLYAFTGSNTFGMDVAGPLVLDSAGNLFGATLFGGSGTSCGNLSEGCGTIFELSPTLGGNWAYSLVYSFCSLANCSDGGFPNGVALDDQGSLYGTTASGAVQFVDGGTAFKLSPSQQGWNFTLLYTFCSLSGCADGSRPSAAPIRDAQGNLYGLTIVGGIFKVGTLFELSPTTQGLWTLHKLYDFCQRQGCLDGLNPGGELLRDNLGNLYGTTPVGGRVQGVVFQIHR